MKTYTLTFESPTGHIAKSKVPVMIGFKEVEQERDQLRMALEGVVIELREELIPAMMKSLCPKEERGA